MLDVNTVGGVQTWTLSFPPVNAISPETLSAMEEAFQQAEADATISVVVITSGLKVFSAGADAAWMGKVVEEEGAERLLELFNVTMDRFRRLCIRFRRSDLLTIAAINGHALAGGLELAAACDLRFAAANDAIKLGASEMKLFGVLPSGGGGAQFIARLMGTGRALDFILRSENISPSRAQELGLIERVMPPDELIEGTISFGQQLAARAGRVGINAAKRSILEAAYLPLYDGLDVDHEVHWDAMRRGGFLPGVKAFVEAFGSRGSRS